MDRDSLQRLYITEFLRRIDLARTGPSVDADVHRVAEELRFDIAAATDAWLEFQSQMR